ncbi:MAG: zinc-binding dehydrogenase [Chloroflexi bacterium]|nr:zinc-binding dehydrogenase [Chloroflexota bacterium]
MKNLSILFTAADRIELDEVDSDILPLGDHEVLTRTRYSLVSAGTELACLSGVESWFGFPGTPGYTCVGEVVEVGAQVADIAPGDMIYSWGGHRQYNVVNAADPGQICVKAPVDMPLPLAPFTRMITVAMTALRISTIELGDFVGVVGLGLVGNFAAQLASLQGGEVIGLDLSAKRVDLAKECSLSHARVIDTATIAAQVAEITKNQGLTTLIEATGNPRALPDTLPLLGRYGEVILVGTPRGAFETDLTDVLSYVHLDGRGSQTYKGAHEWRYPVARDPLV